MGKIEGTLIPKEIDLKNLNYNQYANPGANMDFLLIMTPHVNPMPPNPMVMAPCECCDTVDIARTPKQEENKYSIKKAKTIGLKKYIRQRRQSRTWQPSYLRRNNENGDEEQTTSPSSSNDELGSSTRAPILNHESGTTINTKPQTLVAHKNIGYTPSHCTNKPK